VLLIVASVFEHVALNDAEFFVVTFQSTFYRLVHASKDDDLACRQIQQDAESESPSDRWKGSRVTANRKDQGKNPRLFGGLLVEKFWVR